MFEGNTINIFIRKTSIVEGKINIFIWIYNFVENWTSNDYKNNM